MEKIRHPDGDPVDHCGERNSQNGRFNSSPEMKGGAILQNMVLVAQFPIFQFFEIFYLLFAHIHHFATPTLPLSLSLSLSPLTNDYSNNVGHAN